ncbi:MAG: helix-turn-helix domain-containing protein [Lachnospiraceae bacterium]|jgi:two-component system response regulator YesN|nr:helix-turn-helix domain-containing protein [Lachnospiraceae bacterium]
MKTQPPVPHERKEKKTRQHNHHEFFRQKAKTTILRELITGELFGGHASHHKLTEIATQLGFAADVYQVVISEDFAGKKEPRYNLAELLLIDSSDNQFFEQVTIGSRQVTLLKNAHALQSFERFLAHYQQHDPQEGSPAHSIFLTYGVPVSEMSDIHHSYDTALSLYRYRFFCTKDKHTLGHHELSLMSQSEDRLCQEHLKEFQQQLTTAIILHKSCQLNAALADLESYLCSTADDEATVKHFLVDLYFEMKEQLNQIYHGSFIPFPANSVVINHIENSLCLYEIFRFAAAQIDLIQSQAKSFTRDMVMDNVFHYINHNFQSPITLTSIAPLFGYNNDYLGKLVHKRAGEKFGVYVDMCRINHAKSLLSESNLKVYEVAERAGFANVDCLHKKFKKYVGISPMDYRRNQQNSSL